jgi:hypothetical protein
MNMRSTMLAVVLLLSVAPNLAQAQAVGPLLTDLAANCNVVIYEEDCLNSIRKAFNGSKAAADPDKARVTTAIADISTKNPQMAPRIKEVTEAR